MDENICKFLPTRSTGEEISLVNFVYEKEAQFPSTYLIPSTYTAALVMHGEGCLHTTSGTFPLRAGDLFFLFPAKPYYIENTSELQYAYLSFVGRRAIRLLDRLQITANQPVCPDRGSLCPLWERAFSMTTEDNIDMLCEGLLLYTLSFVCQKKESADRKAPSEGILRVKQYLDLHYTDPALNLKTISERFSYHPKYLSSAFKRLVKINFSEYLCARRLEHAHRLIENGMENVSQLAEMCGYTDPLYFSKAFKAKYGLPPKKYILDRGR